MPKECITLGDHIRKTRIEQGLLQREVADRLDVCEDTVTHWENNVAQPRICHYPSIIAFLGYYPFEHETDTVGGKLKQLRFCAGASYAEYGVTLKADPRNIKDWEQGTKTPSIKRCEQIRDLWQELPVVKVTMPLT